MAEGKCREVRGVCAWVDRGAELRLYATDKLYKKL